MLCQTTHYPGRSHLDTPNEPPTITAMSTPGATPYADWPPELLRLWHHFVRRGELDSHNPPTTAWEAWNQVIEVQARHLREAIEGKKDLFKDWQAEDRLIFVSNAEPGVCVACGKPGLVKSYRKRAFAKGLCGDCSQRRGAWKLVPGGKGGDTP